MNLRFNSQQGLVLDQALALYLRQLEQSMPYLSRAERDDMTARARELQDNLRTAMLPSHRSRRG